MVAKLNPESMRVAMARRVMGTNELAKRAGVSVLTLQRAMGPAARPVRLDTVGKIAEALDVDVTEIAVF